MQVKVAQNPIFTKIRKFDKSQINLVEPITIQVHSFTKIVEKMALDTDSSDMRKTFVSYPVL